MSTADASGVCGWMGRVLRIDLTSREVSDYPWSADDRRTWLGGKSMAARILADVLTAETDPLGPENVMVIATGPLTGTGAPSSARFDISARSPLTGLIASSNCGGPFGTYLKKAGVDALVIEGTAGSPVWLEVSEAGVVFHDADGIWGMRTTEAQEAMASAIDARCGTMVIGPAGENRVLYASVLSGERAAGRAGMGAVLGAKNVKGIAAWGERTVEVAHPEKYRQHLKKWIASLKSHPIAGGSLPALGTAGFLEPMQELGIVATRNFKAGRYQHAAEIDGRALAERRLVANAGCLSCPIRCARVVELEGRRVKGPELETLVLLGANLENPDLDRIIEWNVQLDELGLDTMSTGVTLSYAMEAAEKGLWDNGLAFGQTDGLAVLFEDIAYRRGLGDELAEGSRALAKRYGGEDFAMNVKGLELAAYEPRGAVGQGLGYAVSNRGGCHLNAGYAVALEGLALRMDGRSPRSKAALTAFFQDLLEVVSASGVCLFTTLGVFPGALVEHPERGLGAAVARVFSYAGGVMHLLRVLPRGLLGIPMPLVPHIRALELVTGERYRFGGFWSVGERAYNLERVLGLRFGNGGALGDTLPTRLLEEPQDPADPTSVVPLERLKADYYHQRGWTADGVPEAKLLRRLGIPAR
ncbi:MAG: aldehyde ferredoxin oxidoreductase family protein [Coriobacteriia bacterium]|nr:aldehyde ferredoxin oxidoreductase family protein [Coriobacteriia bacterium]